MKITENKKERLRQLLALALDQLQSVESITIDVKSEADDFIPYLLNDSRWSVAVLPEQIANPNSEIDKVCRAKSIISEIVTEPLGGLKFLDFGCGEGHVVKEAKVEGASVAVGYDIVKMNGVTDDWKDVEEQAPYDVILVYDVLDHVKSEEEAVECLVKIKNVMSEKGKAFIRMHPWCSKHGTHLYQTLNKAYVHLCISEEKLREMGHKPLPTLKIIHPLNTYSSWFKQAGLLIESSKPHREPIDPFFQETLGGSIKKNWKNSPNKDLASGVAFPTYQIEQQFVDYQVIHA